MVGISCDFLRGVIKHPSIFYDINYNPSRGGANQSSPNRDNNPEGENSNPDPVSSRYDTLFYFLHFCASVRFLVNFLQTFRQTYAPFFPRFLHYLRIVDPPLYYSLFASFFYM